MRSRWILAPKHWGSAQLNQIFYPKMLQPLEGLPAVPGAPVLRQMRTITMGSSLLSPQHQGVPVGSAGASISHWEEDWRWGMGDTMCLLLCVTTISSVMMLWEL